MDQWAVLHGDPAWLQGDLLAGGLVPCGGQDCCALPALGFQGFSYLSPGLSWNYSAMQVSSGVSWGAGRAGSPVGDVSVARSLLKQGEHLGCTDDLFHTHDSPGRSLAPLVVPVLIPAYTLLHVPFPPRDEILGGWHFPCISTSFGE